MRSRIAILLLFSGIFSAYGSSLDRTLVAEGDYAAKKQDTSTTLAHWKLWHFNNGEYDVVEPSLKNAHLTQTFRFDAQFLPIGYSIDISPLSQGEIHQHPDYARFHHAMSVSCEYGVRELKCKTDYAGHQSIASIRAKFPYVFVPGEFYELDFTWFLTGAVQLLEKTNPKGNLLNVYTMEDSPTKFSVGEIVLKEDGPISLSFTGEEISSVMDKVQDVRRYEGWGPTELSVLRVTSQGLVGLISGSSTPAVGFGMTNFVEHEPWMLPFQPVLKPTQKSSLGP